MEILKLRHPNFITEVGLRLFLVVVFWISDDAVPFERKIQPEELWLYRFPRTPSYYPGRLLWVTILILPLVVSGMFYYLKREKEDLIQSLLGVYLSIFLTGSVTNFIKLAVGRPRPDYVERCFPDGVFSANMVCTGNKEDVIQGRKSFPSGHSSFAFSSLAYVSLYLAGKFHVFTSKGRGSGYKLCSVVFPLVWATLIAASRTADYHHHWQDVTVGSILGLSIAYLVYRQHYPGLNRANSHLPYTLIPVHETHMDLPILSPTTTPILPLHKMDSAMKTV